MPSSSENVTRPPRAIGAVLLLVLLCGVMTSIQTYFVGNETIYSRVYDARRLALHHAILTNTPPAGGWTAVGAENLNIRLLVVELAEVVARATGLSILKVYKIIDIGFIFLTLLMLYAFLGRDFEPVYRVVGLLYVGCVLPLTYTLHYFHPWDRPGTFLWLAAMWATVNDRFVTLAVIIVIAVTVKFDAVVLPTLYFLARISRGHWRRVSVRTALLFAAAFGTFIALSLAYPGGFMQWNAAATVSNNLRELVRMNVHHPAALAFAVPVALALAGVRDAGRFARAAAAVAGGLLLFQFVTVNFNEFRAQMGAMLLLLPAALFGLRRVVPLSGSPSTKPAA